MGPGLPHHHLCLHPVGLNGPRSQVPPRTVAGRGTRLLWGCPEVGVTIFCPPSRPHQYIDAISSKQGELESYVSDGYKTALTEERRRFCFLVEKQCAVAKNSAAYHSKVRRPLGPLSVSGPGL